MPAHAEGNPQAGTHEQIARYRKVIRLLTAIMVANRNRLPGKQLADLFETWKEGRDGWILQHGETAAPSEATWAMVCSTLRSWP
jgi:hypothetical protein